MKSYLRNKKFSVTRGAPWRGHEVTLFNAGQIQPFPNVETILGDRDRISKTRGLMDAVIDVVGICRACPPLCQGWRDLRHVYISSISAYASMSRIGVNESDPVAKMDDETVEEITEVTDGPLKALCEKVVQEIYGERALIIRPGLIVGPNDPTDRFTYWPVRVARGGDVLAPDRPDVLTQIIDVRDLQISTLS
jgi:2'-hydroxyisoflavone reductase